MNFLSFESGEILLPGKVGMKNIGLPKGVAYVCLPETIMLALDGKFETYTVGRNIEWEKVREIYRLGRKHGMGLAAISGVNGLFSDADIVRVCKLALAARVKAAEAEPEAKATAEATTAKRTIKRRVEPAKTGLTPKGRAAKVTATALAFRRSRFGLRDWRRPIVVHRAPRRIRTA